MDFETIVFLTTALLLMLSILVLAGLVLSARSFTQLTELIHYIGSLLEAQTRDGQHQQTISSRGTGPDTESVREDTSHTTPV